MKSETHRVHDDSARPAVQTGNRLIAVATVADGMVRDHHPEKHGLAPRPPIRIHQLALGLQLRRINSNRQKNEIRVSMKYIETGKRIMEMCGWRLLQPRHHQWIGSGQHCLTAPTAFFHGSPSLCYLDFYTSGQGVDRSIACTSLVWAPEIYAAFPPMSVFLPTLS